MSWLGFLVGAGFLYFAWRRLQTYLHIYQQEEYDGPRFFRWLVSRLAFDRKASSAAFVAGVLQLFLPQLSLVLTIALAAALAGLAFTEADPTKGAKKPLILTARARRILWVAMALAAVAAIMVALTPWLIAWVIPIQLLPLALALANLLLMPAERQAGNRFVAEAREKLAKLRPTVIAVTGSYGKTSVKTLLGHVLQFRAPTLITPGSVNTPLGITRVVREQLTPAHQYFVVEMGAYGRGSIARLCDLTPPDFGIVTAIGPAHYERFRTLEETATAKSELSEAVLAKGGKVVVNGDILAFATPKRLLDRNRARFVTVGMSGADLAVTGSEETPDGIHVDVFWRGQPHRIFAPLHGSHQATNLALAFAAAAEIGMTPEEIVSALRSAPQAAHRLEVKLLPGGAKLIDDAYNSNPAGFASALGLLTLLRREGGRRILVTPGMVELGERHDEEHARLGALAAGHADLAYVVQPERIPSFVASFREHARNGQELATFLSFGDADAALQRTLGPLDVVLIENDLPDLYERRLSL
ncbi:MAG: UDP-N-acetylmuramoyl-tripeptide--D-alanyl-D-alanine ligase [Bauldia sp.]|nr:UDP-N-acetylmuramoyl-tripeptide--D-alanyl-D-alanine ligase [Bauldia sp.]